MAVGDAGSLESRPGVFLIGSPNVGKRTLLSRLLSIDIPDTYDLSSGILCQGWTIETKYYSADLSIWTAHLDKEFSFGTLPFSNQLAALVLVFDISEETSLLALQDWVAGIDIQKFEILLCIGNKADLLPGHYAHTEYRRHLQKRGESFSDPHPEYLDYGLNENEAFSLLGDDEPSLEIRKSCIEWCNRYSIEYIEACASNAGFDKCLSVDGDIQGVDRLYGALSAHMWPGMILKSGKTISQPNLVEKEAEMTDEESDYEVEYEVLSHGSEEQWENSGDQSVPFTEPLLRGADDGVADKTQIRTDTEEETPNDQNALEVTSSTTNKEEETRIDQNVLAVTSTTTNKEKETPNDQNAPETWEGDTAVNGGSASEVEAPAVCGVDEGVEQIGYEDLERLMCQISGMRDNLRLMPDFQRREMAANLAVKMASMFGEGSDEDGL